MHRRLTFVLLAVGALLAPMLLAQTPRGPVIPVNQRHKGYQWLPRVAAAPGGGFVVAWGSVNGLSLVVPSQAWFRLFDANGAAKTPERRVSNIRGEVEGFPAVAMAPDGGFVIVWHSEDKGDSRVLGRRFDSTGQPLGRAFQLSAATSGSQYDPAVDTASDGSFVAVWLQGPELRSETADVYVRRFDAEGQALGPELQVDPAATGAKAVEPRVGADGNGGFVVGWLDPGDGFPERRLLARHFAAGGSPLGPTVQVNTGGPIATVSPLYDMDVAASGEAVFVWTSFDTDVIDVSILGRLFDAEGNPGSTFEVSAFSVLSQERPAAAFGPGGGFYVAWRSQTQTGNALFGRQFSADGTPRGGKHTIMHRRRVSVDYPAVALNEAGQGVVAWMTFPVDAEVVAQRLVQAPGSP